jgi:nitroreductase
MNSIFERRSIRKYTNQEISDETIEKLLRAAMAAPSAGNEQPWHFIVIRDRETLNAIPKFHPYSQMLKEAPAAIIVCGDSSLEKFQGYWVQDCSAATQNILLEAQEMGLGSVWLGVYPMEERVNGLKSLLKLPAYVTPLCILPIGYPAESREPADRYDPIRVHADQW